MRVDPSENALLASVVFSHYSLLFPHFYLLRPEAPLVKVKICGLTGIEDALAACEFGADVIGLNFYDQSPRFLTFERAVKVRAAIGGRAQVAGVFVKPAREFVSWMLNELKLDMLQIHGAESEELLAGWPVPVIRPLSLGRRGRDPS